MEIKLLLVLLQCRRSCGVGEDVALDEVVAGWALVQAFAKVVCCALALQLKCFGL